MAATQDPVELERLLTTFRKERDEDEATLAKSAARLLEVLTPEQQATGMMFRRQMGSNEGMLFVAPDKGIRCFWMRNTFIPLSIAFLDDDGRIVNIADMQPQSDQTHCSTEPVRHALEVNQGWFAKRGIKAGMKIAGPPFRR